jgi:hypothetical protein
VCRDFKKLHGDLASKTQDFEAAIRQVIQKTIFFHTFQEKFVKKNRETPV